MSIVWVIAGICAAFVGTLLLADYFGRERICWLAKPAASAAFVALAVANGAFASLYGQFVLTGLILCMLGDILLIPKNARSFLAGMAAFGLGHLAYGFAFAAIWAGFSGLSVITGLAAFAAIGFILNRLWRHLGSFRTPVAAYCLIIAAMTAMSFSTGAPDGADGPYRLAVIGAVGFAISDISVAWDQFVKSDFRNRLWGLPLYYGAQLVLAASVSI